MNMLFVLKPAAVAATVLLLSAAQAATITKADYQAGKTRISADYKADKAACASLAANAKDICVEEAKAKEKVARTELEYSFTGKSKDRNKVSVAKAESTYAVAKEKCDDKAGNDKDVCVKEAKAVDVKALADAKLGKVYVCENPNLVAIGADQLGARCAPLVCTDGMPAAAQRVLLHQLRASGAVLAYHGDFDWPGIRIAGHVIRVHGAIPWRMGSIDYEHAVECAPTAAKLSGHACEAEWDSQLAQTMAEVGVAVAEEAIAQLLLPDLGGH